jgi:DNA-binding GntR family transcriptional regulator
MSCWASRPAALLTIERLTHDDSGRVVEWARHAYRPDRYAFTVTLVGR